MSPVEWVLVIVGGLTVFDVLLVLFVMAHVSRARRKPKRRKPNSGELIDLEEVDWQWPRRDAA